MTPHLKHLISSSYRTKTAISLSFLLGISLTFVARDLGIVFLGYALILVNSRLYYGRYIHGFLGARAIVRIIRSAIFFVPLLAINAPPFRIGIWSTLAGALLGLLLQIWQFSDLKLTLSNEFIAILPPLTHDDKFNGMYYPILGAIAQEYFYRGVMLYVLSGYIGIWAIIPATFCFTLEHYIHFNADQTFDVRDYVLQTILGTGLGIIFYFSQSLPACIIGHMIYNTPGVLHTMRRRTQPGQRYSEDIRSSEVAS